ncbi:MAG: hypothetical protein H6Q10_3354 [Acidobacteria bacterium]|nr:hypothetical protein [Acidobacteriota bacterium]
MKRAKKRAAPKLPRGGPHEDKRKRPARKRKHKGEIDGQG